MSKKVTLRGIIRGIEGRIRYAEINSSVERDLIHLNVDLKQLETQIKDLIVEGICSRNEDVVATTELNKILGEA